MMIATVLGVALIASVASADSVIVKKDWSDVIKCGGSSGYCTGTQDITLKSVNGQPIQLICRSFRMSASCDASNVIFSEGETKTTKCEAGDVYKAVQIQHISKTGKLTVSINGADSFLRCTGKTVSSAPKDIKELTLSPADGTQTIVAPGGDYQTYDGAWQIKAAEGSKISLLCNAELSDKIGEDCANDVLIIDTGKRTRKFCGERRISVKASQVTMWLQAYNYEGTSPYAWTGAANVTCEVKAISA